MHVRPVRIQEVMAIKLMAVTDDAYEAADLRRILMEIHPYVDHVQIREKRKPAGTVYQLCKELLAEGLPAHKLWLNDRVDIALLLGLKQVHIPGHGLPPEELKKLYPDLRIGAPVHSFEEAIQAESVGVAYALYGHCFPTASKKGKSPQPLANLGYIRQNTHIPLYAIGGIDVERLAFLKAFELDGVAVMSSIFSAANPLDAVKKLREECLRLEEIH